MTRISHEGRAPSPTEIEEFRRGLGVGFEADNARARIEQFHRVGDHHRGTEIWAVLDMADAIQEAKRRMNGDGQVESAEHLPDTLPEKVAKLHETFERHGIPYAVGGAIALDYYIAEPRGTVDIDIDVFLPPQDRERVIMALQETFEFSPEDLESEIGARGQGQAKWDQTVIDLFFSNTDYQEAMAKRTRRVPLRDSEIEIISPEDVVITKAYFDRPKDWLDIKQVCLTLANEVDMEYIGRWLEPGRLARLERTFEEARNE